MPDERYFEFIKQWVTPYRWKHTLGVMQVMGELAEIYGLDKEKAETIGLLHDAAKDFSPQMQQQWINEANIRVEHECENDYTFYMHGPVGAYFVHKELGVDDPLILGAITAHCYCGSWEYFTHPLVWCLRFADFFEPSRDWSGKPWLAARVDEERRLVYGGQMMTTGTFTHTNLLIKWLKELGVPVHPYIFRLQAELGAQVDPHSIL